MNYEQLKNTLEVDDDSLNEILDSLKIGRDWHDYSSVQATIIQYQKLIIQGGESFKEEFAQRLEGENDCNIGEILNEFEQNYLNSSAKTKPSKNLNLPKLLEWLLEQTSQQISLAAIEQVLLQLDWSIKATYTPEECAEIRDAISKTSSNENQERVMTSSTTNEQISVGVPANNTNSMLLSLSQEISPIHAEHAVESLIEKGEEIIEAAGMYYQQQVLIEATRLIQGGNFEEMRAKVRAKLPVRKTLAEQIRETYSIGQILPSNKNAANLIEESSSPKQLKSAEETSTDDDEDLFAEITLDGTTQV